MKKKITLAVICAVLSCVCLIGTTFAWLTDTTATITNTFTVGNVDIDLTETTGDEYKLIPGTEYAKNPTVIVEANSETCWLFVKVVKTNNPDAYLDYSLNLTGWTELTADSVIYYREVATSGSNQSFELITGNKVTVKTSVTKANIEAIGANYPTISFTAYAAQKSGLTVQQAWALFTA